MALTKHQKLARGMKRLSDALDIHFQKTASILNVLQFHFFETHLIIERPLMSEKVLQSMMRVHRWAIGIFSFDDELLSAARNAPLIGFVFTPRFYLRSRVLVRPLDASKNEKLVIPWGVKMVLPAESLRKLEEAKQEAFIYCASESEMSEWIDWYDQEDRATSLTNQQLIVEEEFEEKATFEKNLRRFALPFYEACVMEYYRLPKGESISKTLLKASFAPKEQNDIEIAYQLVLDSLAKHRQRHFEDLQRIWRDRLISLMFEGISWDQDRCRAFLVDYFSSENPISKMNSSQRWETGRGLDRQTYGRFLRYFYDRFIADPLKYQIDGEIALLLWIMVYAARDLKKPVSIKKLLSLTTASLSGCCITVDSEEIELPCGLTNLITEYAGEENLQRQQKLFPHLNQKIDKLEDRFHRASEILLPGFTPALPEAFLIFPHPHKNCRMTAKARRWQLEHPQKILHDSISLKELKRQLIEKSKLNSP